MGYGPTFFLLQKEGYLFQSCLCAGLTALRHSHMSERGRFYVAFFQLSIGIERLAKAIIILDELSSIGFSAKPSNVKTFKHDLVQLLAKVDGIAKQRQLKEGARQLTPIELRIVNFFAEFAGRTRYHNLDKLTTSSATLDPLVQWNGILDVLIRNHLSDRRIHTIVNESIDIATILSPGLITLVHGLDDARLSPEESLWQTRLQVYGAKYATLHTMRILWKLRDVLWDVTKTCMDRNLAECRHTQHIPSMYEFLSFVTNDRPRIMRKWKWP